MPKKGVSKIYKPGKNRYEKEIKKLNPCVEGIDKNKICIELTRLAEVYQHKSIFKVIFAKMLVELKDAKTKESAKTIIDKYTNLLQGAGR